MSLSVVGVVDGPPFDRGTWSGSSHHLFSALDRAGALGGVVDGSPASGFEWAAKVAAVHPRRDRWRERFEYHPLRRLGRDLAAGRRARAVGPAPDALLQIGAYFDLRRVPGPRPRLRCSYHDSNLALFSRMWSGVEDAGAAHIRREWDAERRVFDGLDLIMTMSDWLRQSFLEDFGQNPEKVVTVGAGVNSKHVPDAPVERSWVSPRILFVGLEWERKGGPQVLKSFRRLRAERPDAELWVVGANRPTSEPVGEAGVRWHGRIDRGTREGDAEFEKLHRSATMFVLAPVYDPMPNVFLEAMAYGLPCLGTDVCSLPEMVAHGVTGLLVPPGDPDALHRAMRDLVNPLRAAAMGAAGHERVLGRFTWDGVARRMVAAMVAKLPA